MRKAIISLFAFIPFLFACQEEPELEVSCITKEASQITYNNAVLSGTANVMNQKEVARAGFCYVSADELERNGVSSADLSSVVNFGHEADVCTVMDRAEVTLDLKNLLAGTTYYYLLLVRVGQQVFYGELKSFHTTDLVSQVQVEAASNITQTKAVLNASIALEEEMSLPVEVTLYYSDTESTVEGLLANGMAKPAALNSERNGVSVEIESLKLATVYHYVICCMVGGKAYYSEVSTFSTLDVVVGTSSVKAARVLLTTATLRGKSVYENDDKNASWEQEGWFYFSEVEDSVEGLQARGTRFAATCKEDGSYAAVVNDLIPGKTYYYVACSSVNGKEVVGQVNSFTTKLSIPDEAIDMGLSVLWLGCNLGANSPEENGDYYAWGETATKPHYYDNDYKWGEDFYIMRKYNTRSDRGVVDNKTVLEPEDDIVHVKMGGYWRMPTNEDMSELLENCTVSRKSVKGQLGYEFVSKVNGKKLFFPLTGRWTNCPYPNDVGELGYYWTSSLEAEYPNLACYMRLETWGCKVSSAHRSVGMTIRPVWD